MWKSTDTFTTDHEFQRVCDEIRETIQKAWELLTLGSTSLIWTFEIWCALSMIISSLGLRPPPKAFTVRFLSKIDLFYGKAWSYRSKNPEYQTFVDDLRKLNDYERGLTIGAFLDIMIERYGLPAACRALRKLCDDEKPRWIALEHLETERLKNLFMRLLKWLVTRDKEY